MMLRNSASSFMGKSVTLLLIYISSYKARSAKIVYVKGRQHPVKIYHTAISQLDYVDAALRSFFQIHIDEPPGDVLIFLPGEPLHRSSQDFQVGSLLYRTRRHRKFVRIHQIVYFKITTKWHRCTLFPHLLLASVLNFSHRY